MKFLQNEIFEHYDERPEFYQHTHFGEWWNPKSSEEPSHYSTEINNHMDFLECSIGHQSKELTIYIHWFST